MPTFDEVLKLAAPAEDRVPLCLAGDLYAELRDLERALAAAPRVGSSLADPSPAATIEQQMNSLRERMQAATVTFVLRRISPREWPQFFATRPIAQTEEQADGEEHNAAWFAWCAELVSRSCIDPVMTVEQVGELVDRLATPAWDELVGSAWALNRGKLTVPFFAAGSAPTPTSEPKSRRRAKSASRTANGAVLTLSASPPTSTTTPAA